MGLAICRVSQKKRSVWGVSLCLALLEIFLWRKDGRHCLFPSWPSSEPSRSHIIRQRTHRLSDIKFPYPHWLRSTPGCALNREAGIHRYN
ncbi:hypothetical protein BDV25DRAFT_166524, partial [Aspergillus avenaceus]